MRLGLPVRLTLHLLAISALMAGCASMGQTDARVHVSNIRTEPIEVVVSVQGLEVVNGTVPADSELPGVPESETFRARSAVADVRVRLGDGTMHEARVDLREGSHIIVNIDDRGIEIGVSESPPLYD